MEIITFILISIGIIIIPGPNVLVVVSTSITHGRTRGLQTVAGTSAAMLFQLGIAALGTSWFVSFLASGLNWIKWLGIAYLLYLGIRHLLAIGSISKTQLSSVGSFQRGFWVSLTNPKTILFFVAFLPQFASANMSYLLQITILSFTFWLLAVILDSCYAILAHKLTSLLNSKRVGNYQHGVSGAIYLGAGSILATTEHV